MLAPVAGLIVRKCIWRAALAGVAGRSACAGATVSARSLRRPSTNAVSSARAPSLSASRQFDSAARSQTPSIIAAIIAASVMRLVAGQELTQRMAQVRQHPPLIGGLHAPQPLDVQHLAPEREPRVGGALVELLRREVRVDDRLHAATRRAREPQLGADVGVHAAAEVAERRLEQAVLVAEIVRNQSGGHAGPAGDLRERASHEAKFSETIDRDLDQLLAAVLLEALRRRGATAIGIAGSAAFV